MNETEKATVVLRVGDRCVVMSADFQTHAKSFVVGETAVTGMQIFRNVADAIGAGESVAYAYNARAGLVEFDGEPGSKPIAYVNGTAEKNGSWPESPLVTTTTEFYSSKFGPAGTYRITVIESFSLDTIS